MSNSEGLSRRRGHAGPGANNGESSDGRTTLPSALKPSSSIQGLSGAGGGGGGAGPASSGAVGDSALRRSSNSVGTSNINGSGGQARGHKVAYDPRDVEERSEENEMPKLTLMEEILLLGELTAGGVTKVLLLIGLI